MHASGQQRPEVQVEVCLRQVDHVTVAVVVVDTGKIERSKQAALRLLHVECAVGGALRARASAKRRPEAVPSNQLPVPISSTTTSSNASPSQRSQRRYALGVVWLLVAVMAYTS